MGRAKGAARRRVVKGTCVGDATRPGRYELFVREAEVLTGRFGHRLGDDVAADDAVAIVQRLLMTR